MKLHHLGITLCALLALSCRGSASNQATNATPAPTATAEEEWQAPIEKIGASEIYPTADGGAYVITPNGRLWYVKEQRAYRVSEATGQPARIGANISDRAAGFALLSAERQRSRKLEEALKSAKFEISELKEAQ